MVLIIIRSNTTINVTEQKYEHIDYLKPDSFLLSLLGISTCKLGLLYALCRSVRGVRCRAVPCHAMPCHAVPCHAMPCRTMPYPKEFGFIFIYILFHFILFIQGKVTARIDLKTAL